jgi:hypothetical protein
MFQFFKKCAQRVKNGSRDELASSEPERRCGSGQRYEARSRILEQRRRIWNELPRVEAEEIRAWHEQGRR